MSRLSVECIWSECNFNVLESRCFCLGMPTWFWQTTNYAIALAKRNAEIAAMLKTRNVVRMIQHFNFRIFFLRTMLRRSSSSVWSTRSDVVSIYDYEPFVCGQYNRSIGAYVYLDVVEHFPLFINQQCQIKKHLLDVLHTLLNFLDFLPNETILLREMELMIPCTAFDFPNTLPQGDEGSTGWLSTSKYVRAGDKRVGLAPVLTISPTRIPYPPEWELSDSSAATASRSAVEVAGRLWYFRQRSV